MRCPCHSQNLRTGKGKIVQNLSRTSCTIVTSAATPWIQKSSKNGKSVLPGFYNPKVKKMSEWVYGVDNQRFITLKFDRIDAGRLYHPDHEKPQAGYQNRGFRASFLFPLAALQGFRWNELSNANFVELALMSETCGFYFWRLQFEVPFWHFDKM